MTDTLEDAIEAANEVQSEHLEDDDKGRLYEMAKPAMQEQFLS